MIDHYDWAAGRETVIRFGPGDGPVVLMLAPLFEEHNRTRAFVVTICRVLADLGLASMLPDLPGQNESLVPTEQATLSNWRAAIAALVAAQSQTRPVHLASTRGGAMLDGAACASVWRLSPMSGNVVLRDLERTALTNHREQAAQSDMDGLPVSLAGNSIGWPLLTALREDNDLPRSASPLRTVRLDTDPRDADMKVTGAPLWRRAEPGNDPALALVLATDIADWVARCAG